jgi:hypothetical protein
MKVWWRRHVPLVRRDGLAHPVHQIAESLYITGTDILVDGGWFSAVPYLINERSQHMLSLMEKQESLEALRGSPAD